MTVFTENVWTEHDGAVAQYQLNEYGVVFVDDYGYPVVDKDEQEQAFEAYKRRKL